MQESIQLVIDSLPYLLKGAVFTLQLSIGEEFAKSNVSQGFPRYG